MIKVLVVGQTPPPVHGQAVMIQKLLEGQFKYIKLYHVNMAFSADIDEVGRFSFGKIFHLLSVIIRIIWMRFRHGIDVLYYPPAGPNKVPMYRDFAILILTRWLFSRTVFHFHAGGLSELVATLSLPERWLARLAYYHADCAIRLATLNPEDGKQLQAKQDIVIPYGLEDNYITGHHKQNQIPKILFVAVLSPSKGVNILLDACKLLKDDGFQFTLELMGRFHSVEFEKSVKKKVVSFGLSSYVTFLGVKTGNDKWQAFSKTDIFCFPSFYEAETFGLVVLEAMQFELPVVTTCWRGIPSLVHDGETGYLVAIKDAEAVAAKLRLLLENENKRKMMGKRGREIYLQEFTLEEWYKRMEQAFLDVTKK
ncbi:glycosyltransferase family 4 protein [Candidatus Marithrix sp. Canyon 246]|uniref:glycosyltransferase family 4 protein n=1 Tax=Candidatus Marithrix sp. Canyon 246 TaxID=1827136 RepID=UPI00084A081D|nr:glycosyltransferase family 4 protein [Candidatus Marithrix sp. Canyon 246]